MRRTLVRSRDHSPCSASMSYSSYGRSTLVLSRSITIFSLPSLVILTLRAMASYFGNTEYNRSAATMLTSSYILTTSVFTSSFVPNVAGSPSRPGFPSKTS